MQDHIGEIKHSAKQIYRCNHITRFEKYKLVREELSHLSLKEKEILIAECKKIWKPIKACCVWAN